ncbi:DEAD/DEAH box helicase family protein [Prauserella cavernicola]|uniref:DEAD/DEAH box helicase family protein n=1 Tax=Prauserella cavernicola TaxID=2800127 RepID=A0A934QQE2_9PSEU|nr:DEAD/DEAH box helicase family protein [Prauserella cavernicola]MBK1784455.1 DEAD/DEAH box helicase family protein [Prauserella cavernicola]
MGNFDFVGVALPVVHDDCTKAESYVSTDPRSACFYSRRTIERLVTHLFDVLGLKAPYRNDLNGHLHDAAFKAVTGPAIAKKLDLIRKAGNAAVHETRAVRQEIADAVLRELHHVLIWAAFHHSPHPQAVPVEARFDPKVAATAAPLSHEEIKRLEEQFAAQDAARAKELADKEELLAKYEAEIADLQRQIKAAQAANTATDDRNYNESDTRAFIDLVLHEAGWALDDDRDREYHVTGMPPNNGRGYVDYVLWGADGLPLAVIEAKRTNRSPEVGRNQAKLYADCVENQFGRRPVIFYTNGYEHWIWDDAAGYPPREIQGFYTRDELELLIQRRQTRKSLAAAPINRAIAGRPYQERAIKAVGATFEAKQRQALLVMATGSGKTRTVVALVEQLTKANWVKRVLFLADRTALVNQAVNVFKQQLPSVPVVNLLTEKNADGRVCVATYPTMLNLINEFEGERKYGPGYFDLVVIDEAHRSVFAKYGAIFDWFDSLLLGLTATPKDDVNRSTYRLFNLEDGVPTDSYSLEEAVADGWLVPPKGVSLGTKFLRQGIRYGDLPEEEQDEWDALDWGEDEPAPTEIDAQEVNRFLFNEDTVDKVLATVMADGHKIAGGDRLGKTIIFANNQRHAEFIQRRFDEQWPEYGGQFARVITHKTERAQSLLDDFSQADKSPHIAISVDMLDTGIDVPEVVNLVFFKQVWTTSKFWQMIGRGTRLHPDLFGPGRDKENFYVFDFCGNLEFFSQDMPAPEAAVQKSLSQKLFEARLDIVGFLDQQHLDPDVRERAARTLHELVAGMNVDNVLVRPHRRNVERFATWTVWESPLSDEDRTSARELAGLPSAHRDSDEHAKRFDLLMLCRELAQLEGDTATAERAREKVQELADSLVRMIPNVPSVAEHREIIEAVAGDRWWVDVTLPMLEQARLRLRGLVRLVEPGKRDPVYADFTDELVAPTEVALPGTSPGINQARFRAKVLACLTRHEDHVALQRLRRNRQLTAEDLAALEEMLLSCGVGDQSELNSVAEQSGGLGLFVRSLIGLDRVAAQDAFARYLDSEHFTAEQIRIINMIVEELTSNGVVEPRRLYESPYTDYAPTGIDVTFPTEDVEIIVDTLQRIKSTAIPADVA